jgi:hypothetical protein
MEKLVNRITHILYKQNIEANEFQNVDWRINSSSINANNSVSLYEYIDEDGDITVQFYSYERDGTRFCIEDGNSIFSDIEEWDKNFCGNPYMATLVLKLGWMCWEDEIELEQSQKYVEALGEDYSGEINLEKIKKSVEKFQDENLAVFRTVYLGSAGVSFSDLSKKQLFTPDEFYVADHYEAARFVYRYKK